MDQHPIPQDVTGFQFKLIGTMTVKQFGYVASGVIMAVILYYLPVTGFFWILIKVIFIPLFGGSGAFIAFVPIDGRPVDVMATNFFKAIFSPNQYVYRKQGRKFSFSTINLAPVTVAAATAQAAKQSSPSMMKQQEVSQKEAQLRAYLQSSHSEVKTSLDKKEMAMLSSLALPAAPVHTAASPAVPTAKPAAAVHTPAPAPKPTLPAKPSVKPPATTAPAAPAPDTATKQQQELTLTQQETALQQQLQTAKQEETTTHAPAAHEKVTNLEKQLQEVHSQKQQLEQELLRLKTQLSNQAPAPLPPTQPAAAPQSAAPATVPSTPLQTPTPATAAPAQQPASAAPLPTGIPASQYAKTLAPAEKKKDLPNISDTPNVVVGIVKDPRGNILPNMLVEVKDKDGNPVRAFKTNALGQFASATPLAKGVYTIELDDPKKQHSFDIIQITANNQIMLPIEIISHDAREELRKQLFN